MKKILIIALFLFTTTAFSYYPRRMSFLGEGGISSSHADTYKIFSGTANPQLAENVANLLNMSLGKAKVSRFNDGEVNIEIEDSIRGCDVYILQPLCPTSTGSINDNLMELYLLIRACKRAFASSVTAIVPYYGYARQDRKAMHQVPISASDIAMLLEKGGADHIISIDLHCGQIEGFFHNVPVDDLLASAVFIPYFSKKELEKPVIVSPDAGGVPRAKKFMEGFSSYGIDTQLAIIVKHRAHAGVIEKMNFVGDVFGSDVIIVDDICDTAGTLCHAAMELKQQGAKKVYACITHPIFSPPALERIKNSEIDELVVTDTIPFRSSISSNVHQVSIASLLAKAIERSRRGEMMIFSVME